MNRSLIKNVVSITNEELEKVSGGFPVITVPDLQGIIPIIIPNEPKDEPRDGGATGGW